MHPTDNDLRTEVRRLRRLSMATALALLVVAAAGFVGRHSTKFDEIDVERINVVEKDGSVRLVIANTPRSPAVMDHGASLNFGAGHRPGLIVYNDEQTEAGGLVFAGNRGANGHVSAGSTLAFDQYNGDQTLGVQYLDQRGGRRAGLFAADYNGGLSPAALDKVWRDARQVPDTALRADSLKALDRIYGAKTRLYAGRLENGSSQVTLSDGAGRSRLRLVCDSAGSPRIEFLNDSGRVVRTVGPRE